MQEVALYLDYKLDESYTPCKVRPGPGALLATEPSGSACGRRLDPPTCDPIHGIVASHRIAHSISLVSLVRLIICCCIADPDPRGDRLPEPGGRADGGPRGALRLVRRAARRRPARGGAQGRRKGRVRLVACRVDSFACGLAGWLACVPPASPCSERSEPNRVGNYSGNYSHSLTKQLFSLLCVCDCCSDRGGGSSSSSASSVRANLLQISILASHQNGRDTHVRQVQIFGPRPPATKGASRARLPALPCPAPARSFQRFQQCKLSNRALVSFSLPLSLSRFIAPRPGLGTELSQFSTIEFQQFSQLR